MRSKLKCRVVPLAAALILAGLTGCETFILDGDDDEGVNARGGYYYLLDNEAQELVMLDARLAVVYSRPFSDFTEETYVQGLTFDGTSLWVSISGDDDLLVELDLTTGAEIGIVSSLEAPPEGQGAVRDIAWDGATFWALNSGSATYGNPPELFQLDPQDGSVLARHPLPSPAPRGLCYVGANADVYGSGAPEGCYYTDKDDDVVYRFDPVYEVFAEAFEAPVGPRGASYVYPLGLCFDDEGFWCTNSSGDADYLFSLDDEGAILQQFDLPYEQPGALVWAEQDLRIPNPPSITGAFPNTGSPGNAKEVVVNGRDFVDGLTADFGSGVAVDSLSFVDTEEIVVYVTIATDAALGTRDITLTNPDGQSGVGAGLFQIVEFDPSLGYLWILDNGTDLLMRYSLEEGAVVRYFATEDVAPGNSVQGLAHDGTDIWLSAGGSDDLVVRADTTGGTLSTLQVITAPPEGTGVVRDMTFDGAHLWIPNSGSAAIYEVDPADGAVLDTIPAPGVEPRGVAWADGQLYCNDVDEDAVFVWDAEAEFWTRVFATPTPPSGTDSNRYPTGMAWDGYNFWICNSTGEHDWVFQVAPDGTLLSTILMPDPGDAQPTGIVFTQD